MSDDLEPLKNTHHSLATPQFLETLFEIASHQIHKITMFKRKKIEYISALQSSSTKAYKNLVLFHTQVMIQSS